MIDRRCAFLSPAGPLGGAYAIRPYPDGRKIITVGACSSALPEKRAALRGCYGLGGGKCGTFSCPRVGAYCIRPTNIPPKEGEGPAFGHGQAFAIHGMALCGAYAIRPYPDGRKMIAVGACSSALPERQAAFRGCYGVEDGKCGTFTCPCVGAQKHTLHKRPIYGAKDPNDRSPMRILVPCGAIWWGVCHTPLP